MTADRELSSPGAPRAAELAAATPEDRDRTVDALRVIAITVVVVGHWLMAAVVPHDVTGIRIRNVLGFEPWVRYLTWPLQVMPLFFLVGGFASAASWSSARAGGVPTGAWLAARLRRLLVPVAVLVPAVSLALAVAGLLDGNEYLMARAAKLMGQPLWFLAVYVALVALTPLVARADRRWGSGVLAFLVLGAVGADVAHRGLGVGWAGWVAVPFVWLLPFQLGVAWRHGSVRPSPAAGRLLAAGGFVGLLVAINWLGYGTSLVGAWGGERSNTDPPSIALVLAGAMQIGVAWWFRPALASALERPRVWTAVVGANGVALTVFCWHIPAVAGSVALANAGVFPLAAPLTTWWWLLRPGWIGLSAVLLVVLVAIFGRYEQRVALRPSRWAPSTPVATLAVVASIVALTQLALHGIPHP